MQNFKFINNGVYSAPKKKMAKLRLFRTLSPIHTQIKIEICFVYCVKIESSNDDGIGNDDDKRMVSTQCLLHRRMRNRRGERDSHEIFISFCFLRKFIFSIFHDHLSVFSLFSFHCFVNTRTDIVLLNAHISECACVCLAEPRIVLNSKFFI